MSTMTTTESRLLDRRKAVPLLLSSFPVPPSHIPSTPLGTPLSAILPNAGAGQHLPPSLPPPSPLPPVPGPSPISEHEALMFISAERSRRASKMSLTSTASMYSKRDSTATLASVASGSAPPLSPTSSRKGSTASVRSLRSLASNASASLNRHKYVLDKSPMLEPKIYEEDQAEISMITLSDVPSLSSSSPPPHNSLGETSDEEVSEFGLLSSLSRKRGHRSGPGMNDSISSIDMRDLPALHEEDAEPLSAPPMSTVYSKSTSHLRLNMSTRPRPPTAILNKDLPPLPFSAPPEASSSRISRSDSLSTTRTSLNRAGAESPDISAILASTPRPRRKSSSQFSGTSRSRSRPNSTRRSRGSSIHQGGGGKRFSDATPVPVPALRRSHGGDVSEVAYNRKDRDEDEESDYGEVLDGTGTAIDLKMLDIEAEARLDRQLDGFGSEEDYSHHSDGEASDSSIDVQTPLPNLMLRDGMLSPNSKLLPNSIRTPTPLDRHLSVVSTSASIRTKSGIYKDQRDTVKRRVRHRDGALLRGGIGLTTGLGWSDSEDEDAPSPLTKRVSSMVLSRRTSGSSLNSTRQSSSAHPLSRSVSETMASESLARHRAQMRARDARPSQPPTAWSSARTSTASHVSDASIRSGLSLGGGASQCPTMSLLDHIQEHEARCIQDEPGTATPSSVSGSSVGLPLTPVGDDDAGSWSYSLGKGPSTAARRMPSKSSLKAPSVHSSLPFPRERTTSASSNGSAHASVGHVSSAPSTIARQISAPRPLRLASQGSGLKPKASQSGLRAPSSRSLSTTTPTPSSQAERARATSGGRPTLPSTTATPSRISRSSALSDPPVHSPPITPAARKPRIGAGMVYRTGTAAASTKPSMLRAPSSTNLRSAAGRV